MPVATIGWEWEEAFSKWGFEDGDGVNFTDEVAAALQGEFGCECDCQKWGIHNFMIMSIKDKDGKCPYKRKPWRENMGTHVEKETVGGRLVVKADPTNIEAANGWTPGYDEPRDYLPDEWVKFLDKTFPPARAAKPRKRKKKGTA